jgi:hypothetical protein
VCLLATLKSNVDRVVATEGVVCQKCGKGKLVRREHPSGWKPKPGRYWFRWWFTCSACRQIFNVNDAKVSLVGESGPRLSKRDPQDSTKPPVIRQIETIIDRDELILSDIPVWPGYDQQRLFRCKCGATFERSVGYAKHQVYDCPKRERAT